MLDKVNAFVAPDPKELQALCNGVFKLVNPLLASAPLEAIATLCVELGRLQPFEEGNGRVLRALANALLITKAQRPPVLFDETAYLSALRAAAPVAAVQALLTPQTQAVLKGGEKKSEIPFPVCHMMKCRRASHASHFVLRVCASHSRFWRTPSQHCSNFT